jgi:hypothetical protein
MVTNFQNRFCTGNIQSIGSYDIKVKGHITEFVKDGSINYIAAAPADYRATFTGSGLPFANQLQAFENTPNTGSVQLGKDNYFEIYLLTPNSYMIGLGSIQVPPTLYLSYINENDETKIVSIKVSQGIPYRSMTYPTFPRARSGPKFYDSQFYLPIRTQEEILIDAAYPKINIMPSNHWGLKPPL